jgi:PHP family Zn ribbon phosphoesterase
LPRYAYDLHIHTCLSPCGDNEMTPPNIANMAYVKGLDLIAVTDHNSAKNARAVMNAARDLPLTVIPGAELTTAEEIHVVCLLPDADSAEAFDRELETHMPQIPNQPDYFGDQLLMDENENVTGTFPWLLPNALDLSIDAVPALCEKFGGVCFPAHIDRPANGILAVFGLLPDTPVFPTLEVHDPEKFFADPANEAYRAEHRVLTSSDAHRLGDMAEAAHFLELPENSFAALRAAIRAGVR